MSRILYKSKNLVKLYLKEDGTLPLFFITTTTLLGSLSTVFEPKSTTARAFVLKHFTYNLHLHTYTNFLTPNNESQKPNKKNIMGLRFLVYVTYLKGLVLSLLLVSISCLSSVGSGASARCLFSRSRENKSQILFLLALHNIPGTFSSNIRPLNLCLKLGGPHCTCFMKIYS